MLRTSGFVVADDVMIFDNRPGKGDAKKEHILEVTHQGTTRVQIPGGKVSYPRLHC